MNTKPTLHKFKLFDATSPVTPSDVRALNDFLRSNRVQEEREFHALLERHPALIGVLGFSEFSSEHPLYKRGPDNKPILLDARQRDRADIVAARPSIIRPLPGHELYKSAHIIELKSAATSISERGHGTRLSEDARQAIAQLRDYKRWLTSVQQNQDLLDALGWDVRLPMLYLIMGTASEFRSAPGHLDELRGEAQEQGVCLFTVDDLVSQADRLIQERTSLVDVTRWAIAPTRPETPELRRLVAESERLIVLRPMGVKFHPSSSPALQVTPEERLYLSNGDFIPYLRRDFYGLCAYCRTPDWLGGGARAFGLEHFRPPARFPDLRFVYQNLLYACRVCNSNKAASWPTAAEQEAGYEFIDPLDNLTTHFEESEDGGWMPKTPAAKYSDSILKLNRPALLETRRIMRRLAEHPDGI